MESPRTRASNDALRPDAYGRVSIACLWWCGLGVLSLVLSLLAPNGVLRDPALPPWANAALACTELATLALIVLFLSLLSATIGRLSFPPASPWLCGLARGVRCLVVGTLLFAYAASWGVFWFTGQFLDREAFAFFVSDASTIFNYVTGLHALPLIGVLFLTACFAVSSCEFLPRWIGKWRPALHRRFARVVLALLALNVLAFLGGEMVHAGASRPTREKMYRFRRDHGAGPFTRLISEFFERSEGPGEGSSPADLPRPESRPVCRMEDYLADAGGDAARRFNVVVVMIDSLRADHLGAAGGTREVMPALERLAQESRVFTDCTTSASHTDYAAPSALSSHYPLRSTTVHRYPNRPSYPRVFIYDLLKALGYRTAIFSSQNEQWRQMSDYLDTGSIDRWFHAGMPRKDPADHTSPEGNFDDGVTVAEAVRWIRTVKEDPFFLYLNLQNAHAPYHVPADFPRPFGPPVRDFPISFGWFPREKAQTVEDLYADSLSYIDAQLDGLLRSLREHGLWDRTVIVVTADHGEAFYEHGFAAHGGPLYQEVIRVPLMIRAPAVTPGEDSRPAEIIDIPPSICRALGMRPHPGFQGVDLLSPGSRANRSRFVVVQTPLAHQVAVLRSGHKLIYDVRMERFTLYDLEHDPGETEDVFELRPEVGLRLQDHLAAWYRAQIRYYGDASRHGVEYPPVFREADYFRELR